MEIRGVTYFVTDEKKEGGGAIFSREVSAQSSNCRGILHSSGLQQPVPQADDEVGEQIGEIRNGKPKFFNQDEELDDLFDDEVRAAQMLLYALFLVEHLFILPLVPSRPGQSRPR